jgi:hypothetical protein
MVEDDDIVWVRVVRGAQGLTILRQTKDLKYDGRTTFEDLLSESLVGNATLEDFHDMYEVVTSQHKSGAFSSKDQRPVSDTNHHVMKYMKGDFDHV